VEYIIELLLLRIFETKIKQDDEFKPLRKLFSAEFKWINPKTRQEESNENGYSDIDPYVFHCVSTPFFFYDPTSNSKIILLGKGETKLATNMKLDLKEFKISLNDT
jgi:hypothetical protein